jgi:hypothetical protein
MSDSCYCCNMPEFRLGHRLLSEDFCGFPQSHPEYAGIDQIRPPRALNSLFSINYSQSFYNSVLYSLNY